MGGFKENGYLARLGYRGFRSLAVVLLSLVVACGSGEDSERESSDSEPDGEAPAATQGDGGSELDRDTAAAILVQFWETPFEPFWPCTARMGPQNMMSAGIDEFATMLQSAGYLTSFAREGDVFTAEAASDTADVVRVLLEPEFRIEVALCESAVVNVTGILEPDPSVRAAEFEVQPQPTSRDDLLVWVYNGIADAPLDGSDRPSVASLAEGSYTCSGAAGFALYDDGWRLDPSTITLECDAPVESLEAAAEPSEPTAEESYRESDLVGADLVGMNLAGEDFTGANLEDAVLDGADVTGAVFDGARLNGTSFRGANLSRAILSGALVNEGLDFSEANLEGANLSGLFLNNVSFSQAQMSGADLTGVTFQEARLQGAVLDGAILDGISFQTFQEPPSDLTSASLREVSAQEAQFTSGVVLAAVDLTGADLQNAWFEFADLANAVMVEANLDAARFTSAILIGADLSGAQTSTVNWVAGTICPDGLEVGAQVQTCEGHLNAEGS